MTAYTSADQPVKHVAGSGEVYMGFDTANTGSNTQIMLRVVSLEEELFDVPECQGVPIGVDNILVSQESQPLFRSHNYLCLICEFDRVLCPSRGYLGLQDQESVHTPLGLCGVTAGNTVAVAFEPAGPGSPPPTWPISGESYRRVPHAETDDVKVVVCGSLRAHSVCVP